MKKLLSVLLCIAMIISLMPAAFAEDVAEELIPLEESVEAAEEVPADGTFGESLVSDPDEEFITEESEPEQLAAYASGICGFDLTWTLDEDGVLTISGTGKMDDYSDNNYLTFIWYWRDDVRSVVISDGVTSIGSYAFYLCQNMTSISIPGSVESIGENAFLYCGLSDLVIPEGVTSIGKHAFGLCRELESVSIPGSVTSMGEGVFSGCSWLKNVTVSSGVTSISPAAFSECSSLKSVAIPGSVTDIGNNAFYSCTGLTELVLPEGVTSIGKNAFMGCSNLKSISFPDSLETVSDGAFEGCRSLQSVIIPPNLCEIGNIFSNCSDLMSIGIHAGVTSIEESFFGCDRMRTVFFEGSESEWESLHVSFSVSVSVHYNAAFGEHSFEAGYCTVCGEEEFPPPAIIDYGNGGKSMTWTLNEIGLLNFVGSGDMFDYPSGRSPWYYKENVKNIVLADKATRVGNYAFTGCGVTEMFIPSTVTGIGTDAFADCSSLKNVFYGSSESDWQSIAAQLPADVSVHYNAAFGQHSFEEGICTVCGDEDPDYTVTTASGTCGENLTWALDNRGQLIIDGMGAMEDYLWGGSPWYNLEDIKSVIVAEGVTGIGGYAFQNCSNLSGIEIPESVTGIGDYAFTGCSSLSGIAIPGSVTSLGASAFRDCSSLRNVKIPGSVTKIGNYAFGDCSGLSGIVIQNGVTAISTSMFENCSSLRSIKLPESVTTIGYSAFANCSSLREIEIPDSVTSIGNTAFIGCEKLADENGSVVVRNVLYDYFGSESTAVIPEGVMSIGNYAFGGCSSLTAIEIPDSVFSIDSYAFIDCSGLTSIILPDSVSSIGGSAFLDCSSLESIGIPYNTTFIGGSAFSGCSSLKTVFYGGSESAWQSFASATKLPQDAAVHYNAAFGEHSFEGGICTVCGETDPHSPGDVNDDGKVNLKDAVALLKYVTGEDIVLNVNALDIDNDGKVTMKDPTVLLRFVTGEAVTIY